jgi:hypothetical protein
MSGAVTKQQSTVVLTGELGDGSEVVQSIGMAHEPGVPDAALMGQALTMVRGAGGLTTEGEMGTIYFYPMLTLRSIHLKVNRISLAIA